jgi:hypothetical protein
MVVVPGSTVNIGGPQTQNLLKFLEPPRSSMTGGPEIPVESETTEESANGTITYSHAIYPYADGTHQYIQPGMLGFTSRHIDPKYKITNFVPLMKLNIMQNEAWKEFSVSNKSDAQALKRYLAEYGEHILEEYHMGRGPRTEEMENYYRLAKSSEFKYITKFGILNSWNFAGAVLSKGESTGPDVFLDRHSSTDIVFVVGVVAGKQARVSNIWCRAKPGDKLALILTRRPEGPLVWVPYNYSTSLHPPRRLAKYEDASGRSCDSYILHVGTVTEANERDTLHSQTEMALGYYNDNVKDAYEANGSLTTLVVQIRL